MLNEKMLEQKSAIRCGLCDLPVGRHPFLGSFDGTDKSFCCLGCLQVYTILRESGALAEGQDIRQTELFQRSLAMGLISNSEWKAEQTVGQPAAISPETPTQEGMWQVSGMWCSACAWLIEHALSQERGVVSVEAFFASDMVKVRYCPQYLPPDRVAERIRQLGYQATQDTADQDAMAADKRDLLLRLGIGGFLWLNIMTLSTPLYVGYFEQISESVRRGLPFVLLLLATPVVFYSAQPILRLMWQGFRNRVVRMETLLGIGILAAYVYSAVQAFRGGKHVYFDTASAIVTLVLLGKLIERNAKERTTKAITWLYRLMPKKVRLWFDGKERFVAAASLSVGDLFIVKTGERIPADGVVVEGASHADESLLTGESIPVEKEPGSQVVAGSINVGGVLQVRATKIGADTTLAQIIHLVEQALGSKSNLERTVDRLARVFVPAVLVIAALTFLGCWLSGWTDVSEALMRAITVLVIACPCALGMATPLAITAAIGAASRQGILVSDSRVLETIRRVDTVIFDKTGTLTEGDFTLLDYVDEAAHSVTGASASRSLGVEGFSPKKSAKEERFIAETLPLVASLERYSEHPLGRAIVRRAEQANVTWLDAQQVEVHKGLGITGTVAGYNVFVGNRRLAEREVHGVPAFLAEQAQTWESVGRTVAFFGWDGQIRGLLMFGDRIKEDAAAVVSALKQRGIQTMVVSGDARATTAWVAASVGANDFLAETLPTDKTTVIKQLQARGQVVAMIGDGVNDAPALAQADLGVAVSSGADIAMRAAAIVCLSRSLNRLLPVFDLAHKTWHVVRQNLFWAFFYNTLGISLAITGILTPILAAVAMLFSSLSVIGNSLRLTSLPSADGSVENNSERITQQESVPVLAR